MTTGSRFGTAKSSTPHLMELLVAPAVLLQGSQNRSKDIDLDFLPSFGDSSCSALSKPPVCRMLPHLGHRLVEGATAEK